MVALLEILLQPFQAHAQQSRGQIVAVDRGPDQKTVHAHHAVQLRAALFGVPANPPVPRRQPQRRRGKTERAQPAVFGTDQVAELPADQRSGTLMRFKLLRRQVRR